MVMRPHIGKGNNGTQSPSPRTSKVISLAHGLCLTAVAPPCSLKMAAVWFANWGNVGVWVF